MTIYQSKSKYQYFQGQKILIFDALGIRLMDYIGELELLELMNCHCLAEEKVPQDWKDAFVVSIYKGKGMPQLQPIICISQYRY